MHSTKVFALAIGFIFLIISVAPIVGYDKLPIIKDGKPTGEAKGFAVLELFTSEGCSSCPPADELMSRIQKETEGKLVFILTYHVDYWDRYGWKDRYSNAAFSKRQIRYGNWLNVSSIYTPQVIINGSAEFVGSNESDIRKAISIQLSANPNASLSLQVFKEGDGLKVKYQALKTGKDNLLLIALLQKTAQSKVERGENAGRTLSHVQIVREFYTGPFSATGTGNVTLVLPKNFDLDNGEIVALIQEQSKGKILAAAKADLNGSAN